MGEMAGHRAILIWGPFAKGSNRGRFEMDLKQVESLIQSTLVPVVMISGCGLIALVVQTRYGRIIDRIRALSEERRRLSEGLGGIAHHGDPEDRLRAIEAQMATLVRRGLLVKRSLFFIASSVFSFVLTSFLLYLAYVSGAPLDRLFAFLTPLAFLAGMTFLLIGMIAMVLEVAASYSSTLAEVGMGPGGRGDGSGEINAPTASRPGIAAGLPGDAD
jgi:hypothetical protein